MGLLILGKPLLRHGVPAALPDVLVVGVHGGSGLVPVAPGNLVKKLLIKRGVGIVKLFLSDFGYHAADEGNLFLIFLMGHLNGAEHGVVVHLVGPGLDHDHLFAGRDDHHIQIGEFLLFLTGIQHQFPVHKAHFQGPDRAVPGNVGDGEGGGSANQRGDFRGAVNVHAHDRTHNGHVVAEIIGEERADRAVNDAGGEDGALGRASLAAGDTSHGIEFFFKIHAEGKEIDALSGAGGGGDAYQNAGFAIAHHNGPVGKFGQLSGFQYEGTPGQVHLISAVVGKSSLFDDG